MIVMLNLIRNDYFKLKLATKYPPSEMTKLRNLILEATSKTPQVELNQFTGDLILSGRSIPENATKIYEPVLNWVKEYIQNARPTTNFRLDLEYFNTATSIWLAKILKMLNGIKEPDYVLIVHLYLSVVDFDVIADFEDIKDAFPIAGLDQDHRKNYGIKLYGRNNNGLIVKEILVFVEAQTIQK